MIIEAQYGSEEIRQDFINEYNKLSLKDRETAQEVFEQRMEELESKGCIPLDSLSFTELVSPSKEDENAHALEIDESEVKGKKRVSVDDIKNENKMIELKDFSSEGEVKEKSGPEKEHPEKRQPEKKPLEKKPLEKGGPRL